MINLLSPWLLRIGCLLALVAGLFFAERHIEGIGYNKAQIEFKLASAQAAEINHSKEVSMQTSVDNIRKESNEQIIKLAIDLDSAKSIIRMQHPTDRPPEYTPSTDTGHSCSGASLFTSDAEFLAGEAARADKIRLEYLSLVEQYNVIAETLNKGVK